jgi:hypothetical protein
VRSQGFKMQEAGRLLDLLKKRQPFSVFRLARHSAFAVGRRHMPSAYPARVWFSRLQIGNVPNVHLFWPNGGRALRGQVGHGPRYSGAQSISSFLPLIPCIRDAPRHRQTNDRAGVPA